MIRANRRFLHGTRQIIEFNWPRYLASGIVILAGLLLALRLGSGPTRLGVMVGVSLAVWWSIASIVASWWIYDVSNLTTWRWLPRVIGSPARWANVHSGFDETTNSLEMLYPSSSNQVVDIYDAAVTTEASIERARRKVSPDREAEKGSWRELPLNSASQDAIFFLFAAHEVRSHKERKALFREAARALDQHGIVVVVEHLRDMANFIVFGPGFLHFLPRRAWTRAAGEAGLRIKQQISLNPFIALFVWEKTF